MDLVHTLPSKLATSMLRVVMQQLASPAIKEVGQIWNVDEELEELLATYEKIRASIETWEGRYELDDRAIWEIWLQKLEGYCYDTEDVVDYLGLLCPMDDENPSKNHPIRTQIFTSFAKKPWGTPHKIGKLQQKLKRVSRWIEGVLDASTHRNRSHQPHCPQASSAAANGYYTSPLSDKTPFVSGTSRDQDQRSIIKELTSSEALNLASGVSVIGMDGLGKTALVRTILTDETIQDRFSLIVCAHISGAFRTEEVVRKLEANYFETTSFQKDFNLQRLLHSHRALIVLDDLWSVTEEEWYFFRCNYLSSFPGWKILVTTRNSKVAEVTESVAHLLDTMTDEDCKEMIMQRANFCESNREIWDSDLEIIAKKCKGMPILATKFGLHLYSKRSVDELTDTIVQFKNQDLWQLPEFLEMFASLKLQPHLKRCFAYFSLFSSNHKFSREELIQLWEAEGFVRLHQKNCSLPTGSECFDQLLTRSILKPLKSPSSDGQTMYAIHEFNHEFAQRLASEAFRRIDEGKIIFPSSCEKKLRHLSLNCENTDVQLLKKIEKCRGLRTFLLPPQYQPKRRAITCTFFGKLERLRLLGLSHTTIRKLEPVKQLKLLRYLDLSNTDIETLPDSIRHLRALQILKLEDCSKLNRLPKDFNQLISLTHLHVNMKRLACLPSKLGLLTNLEILSSFIVGNTEGNMIEELKNMEHLREICISRLEKITNREDAQKSMLNTKRQLKRLVLEWDNSIAEMVNASDILEEGLKPHVHLKELILRNYRGQQFPTWLSSLSQKLVTVCLQNCPDCEALPSLGQLPLLKTLVLNSIEVKNIDGQFCGQSTPAFRYLESLEFCEMGSLLSWTGLEAGDMPRLHTLKIIGCRRLTCLPSLIHQGCLVYFEINDCVALESLPEVSSSILGECAKLIIVDSPLVEARCQVGGPDWPKIKNITNIMKFETNTSPDTSTVLPAQTNKWLNYIDFELVVVLMKRCVLMRRNKGVYFYKPYWVLLLVVMLIPILLSVVMY